MTVGLDWSGKLLTIDSGGGYVVLTRDQVFDMLEKIDAVICKMPTNFSRTASAVMPGDNRMMDATTVEGTSPKSVLVNATPDLQ